MARASRRSVSEPDAKSKALQLFGRDSRPGSEIELVTQAATTLIVAAPGGRIVDGDPPASELLIEVRRANPDHPRATGATATAG